MKVLFYNDYSEIVGGAETYQAAIVAGLRERGVEVYEVFGTDLLPRKHPLTYQLQLLWRGYVPAPAVSKRLDQAIKRFQPDVIHLNNNRVYTKAVCEVIREYPIPVISMMHDYHFVAPKPDFPFAFKQALKYAKLSQMAATTDVFVSPTDLLKQHLVPIQGVGEVQHIPCPIDTHRWQFAAGAEKRPPNLLYYGRIVEIKGVLLLPALIKKMRSQFPHIQLTMIGEGVDRGRLEETISQLQVAENIHVLGAKSPAEILKYLHAARALVVPSIFKEPFGLVGIEAQAAGTPVAASNIGGIPEWCTHEETGLLFEAGNIDQMAQQVIRLLTDSQLVAHLTTRAHDSVQKVFDKEVILAQLIALYNRLTQTKSIVS